MKTSMSTSSCKRPRADSAAGVAEESNSCPSTSAPEVLRCAYQECRNPPHWRSTGSEGKFCGAMHRNLFMGKRASSWPFPVGPERHTSSWEVETTAQDSAPKCMLPTCKKRVWGGPIIDEHFEFCGKQHMLDMVEMLAKAWSQEGRICRLKECCRHVYAEENGKCYDYCGMKHATLAAARRGAAMVLEAAATATLNPKEVEKKPADGTGRTDHNVDCDVYDETDKRRGPSTCQKGKKRTLYSLIDSERGYHDKISDRQLQRLLTKDTADDNCSTVQHGINIYEFHPWELVTKHGGYRPRYFVHFVIQQRHRKGHCQKTRKTKEGFSWKQSSKSYLSPKGLETRYFKYLLDKPDQHNELPHVQAYAKFTPGVRSRDKSENMGKNKGHKCRWKMHEIMLSTESKTDSKKVIWMVFQDADGEPVWPPCRQPDLSEGIVPALETLPNFVTRVDENFVAISLADKVTPTRESGTDMVIDSSANPVLDPLQTTNFLMTHNEDNIGLGDSTTKADSPNNADSTLIPDNISSSVFSQWNISPTHHEFDHMDEFEDLDHSKNQMDERNSVNVDDSGYPTDSELLWKYYNQVEEESSYYLRSPGAAAERSMGKLATFHA